MFTKAVTFRNFLIKNLKQYIRSKSTRYSYSEEEYADRQKYNNIRVRNESCILIIIYV